MKRLTVVFGLLIVAVTIINNCYDDALTRPTPQASLSHNYELVGQQTMRQFPGIIISTDLYDSYNGYIMGFLVRRGITRAQVGQIIDYAYPRWAMIRRWAGMGEHAGECNVTVWDTNGKVVSPTGD